MNENILVAILVVAGGVLSIVASIFNWNWFFENRRAYIFNKILGRTGARIFYNVLGIILLFIAGKILKII